MRRRVRVPKIMTAVIVVAMLAFGIGMGILSGSMSARDFGVAVILSSVLFGMVLAAGVLLAAKLGAFGPAPELKRRGRRARRNARQD